MKVKLHGKKKKLRLWFGSFNGISITCKLEMDFFFHNSERSAVRHVHVTSDMAIAQEFRSGLSKFHRRNEVT